MLARRGGRLVRAVATQAIATGTVITERIEGVLLIGLNRPTQRNALNAATADRLAEAFDHFETDSSLKVGVLYGKGGHFCSGLDLKEVAQNPDLLPEMRRKYTASKARLLGPPRDYFKKPMIAAVNGYAVSEGLELALLCDLRCVEETAVMGFLNRRFGIPITNGATVRLPRLVGLSHALDLVTTGRKINGRLAYEMGLASRLVAVGTALGQAVNLARVISQMDQTSLAADRRSLYHSALTAGGWSDGMDFEFQNALPVLLQQGADGAKMFAAGIGRHGSFKKPLPSGPEAKHLPG